LAQERLGDGRDLGVGLRQVRLWLQKDFRDRATVEGGGLQVFDIVDGWS
jgi:hypothetical protein